MRFLFPLILMAASFGALLSQSQNRAQISYYTGGESLLQLQAPPAQADDFLDLRGTSRLKMLMIEITSPPLGKKSQTIPLNADGSFSVRYLIKTGPGVYRISLYGSRTAGSLQFEGIGFFNIQANGNYNDASAGTLNQKVLDFVNESMGKIIGRGECWDLVQAVLDREGADWSRPTRFGKLIDPATDEILPGDIIQFRSFRIEEKLPGGVTRTTTLGVPNHTSIIYEVLGPLHYRLAHQNVSNRRFVQVTEMDLNKRTSGSYFIYRPIPGILRL